MVRAAHYLYTALAWAFAAGIVLQVFFIGLGLFVGAENLELHTTFGWLLHLGPLPVLVAAALASAGRAQILQATALVATIFFVPILAAVRSDLPFVAAFHPVGARRHARHQTEDDDGRVDRRRGCRRDCPRPLAHRQSD